MADADYVRQVPALTDLTLRRLDADERSDPLTEDELARLRHLLRRRTKQMRRARRRWEKRNGAIFVEPPHLPY